MTNGPFADTKEVLGGFALIEATNLDEVIELAARIPLSRTWYQSSDWMTTRFRRRTDQTRDRATISRRCL
jgi:hypothetical protein